MRITTDSPLVLSREEVRKIDSAAVSQLGIPGLVLMENAARGVADVVIGNYPDVARRVILCGYGNNGGDGLALARQLAAVGVDSEVLLLRAGKKLSEDAAANFDILNAAGVSVVEVDNASQLESLSESDLLIDCLLGTGVQGAVREPFARMISAINSAGSQVLSVDVPSGMDCDSGVPVGECVKANQTVTFVGIKAGFQNPGAVPYLGEVSVAHIGLPDAWVRSWLGKERAKGVT